MRIAAVQMNPRLGAVEDNVRAIERWTESAAEAGADIVLFPECSLQGIVFASPEEAESVAEPRDGARIDAVAALARRFDVCIAVGFLEQLADGIANTVCVAFPGGERRFYQKTHVTALGADRWVQPGPALSDILTFRGLNFGVIICYDVRFPEATRVLALQGADAVLLSTNSPTGYEGTYEHAARTRAWENRIWFAVANRIGEEADATFVGRSLIVDPFGRVVAQAGGDEETLLVADVDVSLARSKLLPGHAGNQYDFLSSRRPDLYGPLVESPARARPREETRASVGTGA